MCTIKLKERIFHEKSTQIDILVLFLFALGFFLLFLANDDAIIDRDALLLSGWPLCFCTGVLIKALSIIFLKENK